MDLTTQTLSTLTVNELERTFGFPDDYTLVNNISDTHRKEMLGRSWSVAVIQALLQSLKPYFSKIPDFRFMEDMQDVSDHSN